MLKRGLSVSWRRTKENYYLCACACYMMGEEIKTMEFCQNALLQLDDKGYKKLTKDLIERIQK